MHNDVAAPLLDVSALEIDWPLAEMRFAIGSGNTEQSQPVINHGDTHSEYDCNLSHGATLVDVEITQTYEIYIVSIPCWLAIYLHNAPTTFKADAQIANGTVLPAAHGAPARLFKTQTH